MYNETPYRATKFLILVTFSGDCFDLFLHRQKKTTLEKVLIYHGMYVTKKG